MHNASLGPCNASIELFTAKRILISFSECVVHRRCPELSGVLAVEVPFSSWLGEGMLSKLEICRFGDGLIGHPALRARSYFWSIRSLVRPAFAGKPRDAIDTHFSGQLSVPRRLTNHIAAHIPITTWSLMAVLSHDVSTPKTNGVPYHAPVAINIKLTKRRRSVLIDLFCFEDEMR